MHLRLTLNRHFEGSLSKTGLYSSGSVEAPFPHQGVNRFGFKSRL